MNETNEGGDQVSVRPFFVFIAVLATFSMATVSASKDYYSVGLTDYSWWCASDLYYSDDEASYVASKLGARSYGGTLETGIVDDDTIANTLAASDHDVFHFSGHGGHEYGSWGDIVLQANKWCTEVDAADIDGTTLADMELVFASACQTTDGTDLANEFFNEGAKVYIGFGKDITDYESYRFAQRFYFHAVDHRESLWIAFNEAVLDMGANFENDYDPDIWSKPGVNPDNVYLP